MTRWQANLLLLLAGAIWGMGFVAQSEAMHSIGPFLFIGLRFLVASLVVVPFALREARRAAAHRQASTNDDELDGCMLSRMDTGKFAVIGLVLFAGMATQQVGLLTTSVTNSGFLTGLYVVFTPLIVTLFFRESLHRIVWLAALLSIAGIYLLSGGNLAELVVGDFLTLLCAVFWAVQLVLIARFVGQSGRPLALSLVQFVVTAGIALIVAMLTEPIELTAIIEAGPSILYSGVFASGLAFSLQVIGQRYTSAPQAAIFLSSEAPFAALFAFWQLGERIGIVGLFGCALIFLAMMVAELVPMWQAGRISQSRGVVRTAPDAR